MTKAETKKYLAKWKIITDEFEATGFVVQGFDPGIALYVNDHYFHLDRPEMEAFLCVLKERRELLEKIGSEVKLPCVIEFQLKKEAYAKECAMREQAMKDTFTRLENDSNYPDWMRKGVE